MTLPTSGPLTLAQIQGEFGGGVDISLSEYYSGGGLVPSGTIGYPGGFSTIIPTGGAISIANFYGSTAIQPQPTAYKFMRFIGDTDRVVVYRCNLVDGSISAISATSLHLLKETRVLGLTNVTELAKTTPNGPSASIIVGPVYRSSYVQPDPYGQTYFTITHQPTASEPYVDIRIDDDGPPSFAAFIVQVIVQLGNGGIAPSVSTAPEIFGVYLSQYNGQYGGEFVSFHAFNLLPSAGYTLTTYSTSGSTTLTTSVSVSANGNGDLDYVGTNSAYATSNWYFTYTLTGNGINLSSGPHGPYDFTPPESGGGGQ